MARGRDGSSPAQPCTYSSRARAAVHVQPDTQQQMLSLVRMLAWPCHGSSACALISVIRVRDGVCLLHCARGKRCGVHRWRALVQIWPPPPQRRPRRRAHRYSAQTVGLCTQELPSFGHYVHAPSAEWGFPLSQSCMRTASAQQALPIQGSGSHGPHCLEQRRLFALKLLLSD